MTGEGLKTYLNTLPSGEETRLVVGHPAPDADAVVSALFEAWRLTRAGIPAAPAVQGAMPRECAWLLGDAAALVPVVATPDPAVPLVLTDHHDTAAYPNPVVAIVDHHPVSPDTDLGDLDAEIAPVGAATTLVARRLSRDGITPDAVCARILLGAILLDTEGLSSHKAKAEDVAMARWLLSLCGEDAAALFAALRAELLSETDVTALYRRDYRRYTHRDGTPMLGWAILKVWADACPDLDAVRRLLAQDTAAPTRVAKIVLNSRTDESREEHYLATGERADALLTLVQTLSGPGAVRTAADQVFLPAGCAHWGRKRYAAKLMELWSEKS